MAEPITGTMTAVKAGGPVVGRGVSLVFSKIMRIRHIQAAHAGKVVSAEARTALSDYETHLAIKAGQFSVEVRDFHAEIQRSGLIDAIIELAITSRDSDAVKQAFTEIACRYLDPTVHDYNKIYDDMRLSFQVSVANLVKDPALQTVLKSFVRGIHERLDLIESSFKSSARHTSSNFDIRSAIDEISSGLTSHFKTLRIETLRGNSRDVNISDIYVAPSLTLLETRKNLEQLAQSLPDEILGQILPTRHRIQRSNAIDAISHVPYADLKSSFQRVVILGDPGGGKSTLCQRICYDLARATQLASAYPGENKVNFSEQRLPFRITLRLYEQARASEPQLDILTYLLRDLKNYSSADDETLRAAVLYLLRTGRAVLAFDGLDEILETSNRRLFVDLVSAFCDQFPLCPVLITSRIVGYDTAPMPKSYEKLILQRFSEPEVQQFANKFLVQIGEYEDHKAKIEAGRFLHQTNENASDLRNNPLMLGLMLWIFMAKGDVPSNRPAIYGECADLMFDKWDTRRGIRPSLPRGLDRSQVFTNIAGKVYNDKNLRAGISREWLILSLEDYFSDKFVNGADAAEAAQSLADFLVGRAWIMMEAGDGVFSFTHQTFLEYFYARSVVRDRDSVKQIFGAVRSKIIRRESDVVNHLALQIKTTGNDRLQAEAMHEMQSYLATLSNVKSKKNVIAFMAKSLEYLASSQFVVRDVLSIVYRNSVEWEWVGPDCPLSVAVASCGQLRSFATDEVVRLSTEAVEFHNDAWAAQAAQFIVSSARALRVRGGRDAVPLAEMALAVRPVLETRGEHDIEWARRAFSLYGCVSEDWVRRYGAQFLFENDLAYGFDSMAGIDALLLSQLGDFVSRFTRSGISKQQFRESARVAGRALYMLVAQGVSIPERSPYQIDLPLEIWVSILDEAHGDDDLFVCTVIAMSSASLFGGQAEFEKDCKRAIKQIRDFLRRNKHLVSENAQFDLICQNVVSRLVDPERVT